MISNFTYLNEMAYYLLGKSDFVCGEYNMAGSRLCSKTYSFCEEIAILIGIAIKNGKKVAKYCFRKLNKDIGDLVKEIYEALVMVGFVENIHFTLKFPNKNADFRFKGNKSFIRVMGVYSNSNERIPLKGLSRSEIKGFDLAVEFLEEASEFTNAEKQAISFAIGVCKKRVRVTACNPDNLYLDHIQYLNERLPFCLETMQTKNEQYEVILENNIWKTFHYANWKLNKHNLSDDVINMLEELKLLDPVKAQSWYWGAPALLEGSIFARYLDKVSEILDFYPNKFIGGLDIGLSSSASGHPTAGCLWLIGENKNGRRLHKESEYFHSNATMKYKDTYELANDIIEYYMKETIQFGDMRDKGFTCFVDYGGGGLAFIDVLNSEKQKRNLWWLKFEPCEKEVFYLLDRIDFTTICLIKGVMSFNWKRCPQTKKQYSLMQWMKKNKLENSNNQPQMLDLHDDTWDSDCMALMKEMRPIMQGIGSILTKKSRWN